LWRDRKYIFPVIIFLLALAIRLVYLGEISSSPGFRFPLIDAFRYFKQALTIASGDYLVGKVSYWQPPLYPYLLGVGVSLFGPNHVILRLAHFVLGAINCVLIYLLGCRIFSERVSKGASLVACLYGPFLYFEGEYLPPVLLVFLAMTTLVLLFRVRERPINRRWFTAGLVVGLHTITRPDILLFIPLAIIWLWFGRSPGMKVRRFISQTGLLLIGVILPILPVTVRNYAVEGIFVPISYNGGINFYIGNNPDFDRTVGVRPGVEWLDLVMEPFLDDPVSTRERSAYFMEKSLDWIGENPGDWLRLMARKSAMFWKGHEFIRNLDLYSHRNHSRILSILLWERGVSFPFGLVAPLAILGIALALIRRRPGSGLLVLFTASSFVSVVFFFVASRYRIPLIPVLLLFAVYGVTEFYRSIRSQRWLSAIPSFVVVVILAILVNESPSETMQQSPADRAYWEGTLAYKRGDYEVADVYFRRAILEDPSNAQFRIDDAMANIALGNPSEAEKQLRWIVDQEEESSIHGRIQSHKYLGILYRQKGDFQVAEDQFRAAIAMAPRKIDARLLLARLMIQRDQLESAGEELSRLLEIDPSSDLAYIERARISLKRGRMNEAIGHLEKSIELNPKSVRARVMLANALLNQGSVEEARELLSRAIEVDPADKDARRMLERLEREESQTTRP
jgi:tetratricopeptide (TPR) repeat protein